MSNYPRKEEWPYTLADELGPWCTDCFGYMDPEPKDPDKRYEEHHIVQTAFVKRLFNTKRPTHKWFVPAHSKPCHDECDWDAGEISRNIRNLLNSSFPDLSDRIRDLHNGGAYGLSQLLRWPLIDLAHRIGDYDTLLANIKYSYASGSATSWAPEFEKMLRDKFPSDNNIFDRWDTLLNRAKEHAIRNDHENAHRYLAQAEDQISRFRDQARHRAEVVLRRSRASIFNHRPRLSAELLAEVAADAEYALAKYESTYTQTTAKILHLPSYFKQDSLRSCYECVEELLDKSEGLSWGYIGMSRFFRALTNILSKCDWRDIYKDLVVAQYIFCTLGLRGHAHRCADFFFTSPPDNCMPGHILCNLSKFGIVDKYSPGELTALRKEAIGPKEKKSSLWRRLRESLINI